MDWLGRFWRQPAGCYRNFQIVFTLLTLNFLIPALSYIFTPEVVVKNVVWINEFCGGAPYLFPEAGSRLWRYLGCSNVLTLALMCFLLQWNLRRHRGILFPLCFLKAGSSILFFCGYFAAPQYPFLLVVGIFDGVTTLSFLFFAIRAHRQISHVPDEVLVPAPQTGGPGLPLWSAVERRWANELLACLIPAGDDNMPGFAELDAQGFWDRFDRMSTFMLHLGFRAGVWVLTWSPLFVVGSPLPFHYLSEEKRTLHLKRMFGSSHFIGRQLSSLIKAVACFGYFRDVSVREYVEHSTARLPLEEHPEHQRQLGLSAQRGQKENEQ